MTDVASLAMPFFGLIALGFLCGKLVKGPEEGLAWFNVYIVYVAVPALYFVLISRPSTASMLSGRPASSRSAP